MILGWEVKAYQAGKTMEQSLKGKEGLYVCVRDSIEKSVNHLKSVQGHEGYWSGGLKMGVGSLYDLVPLFLMRGDPEGSPALRLFCDVIEQLQNDDGGWGHVDCSTLLATHQALVILRRLRPGSNSIKKGESRLSSLLKSQRLGNVQPYQDLKYARDRIQPLAPVRKWSELLDHLWYPIFRGSGRFFSTKEEITQFLFQEKKRGGFTSLANRIILLWLKTKHDNIPLPELLHQCKGLYPLSMLHWIVPATLLAYLRAPALSSKKKEGIGFGLKFLQENQFDDGSFVHLRYHALIALAFREYGLRDEARRCLNALSSLRLENDLMFSPLLSLNVPFTAQVLSLLLSSGLPAQDPAIRKGRDWLVEMQNKDGSWGYLRTRSMGPRDFIADSDDTAIVLSSLMQSGIPPSSQTIRKGLTWVQGLQNTDGAFVTWNEFIDFTTVSATAHALEAFARAGHAGNLVQKTIAWLKRSQCSDGSWCDYWWVRFIPGTSIVIGALLDAGLSRNDSLVLRGARWLVSRQNPDGGWGESWRGGKGPSSVEQTGWALHGILRGSRTEDLPVSIVEKGLAYLLARQGGDGSWSPPSLVGCFSPNGGYADTMVTQIAVLQALIEYCRRDGARP